MEELKSCLFCGKHVDTTFQFCPHCGYDFGQIECVEHRRAGEDLSALVEQAAAKASPGMGEDYLVRLRTLQEVLSDLERELDLIIKTSSKDP